MVSLTTSPRRIQLFRPVVESILAQSIKPEAIYLNLPDKFRGQATYSIPDWLPGHACIRSNRAVKEDWGPIMKLLPVLSRETDPDTIILTIDDDVIFPPEALTSFVEATRRQPATAFCSMGFRFAEDTGHILPVRGHLKACHGLQGFSGCCYRRAHFDEAALKIAVRELPKEFQINDDIILSNHLASRGVRRATVQFPSGRLEFTEWSDNDPHALKSAGPGTHARYQQIRKYLQARNRWHLTDRSRRNKEP